MISALFLFFIFMQRVPNPKKNVLSRQLLGGEMHQEVASLVIRPS
jgi:hypothetical protein